MFRFMVTRGIESVLFSTTQSRLCEYSVLVDVFNLYKTGVFKFPSMYFDPVLRESIAVSAFMP